ncbi:MAG TPA: YdcF family protein [Streptosporangiaceae bacterium]
MVTTLLDAGPRAGLLPAGRPALRSRVLVADHQAAERVAIELARNHLIAHPGRNLVLAGSADLPMLRAFLQQAAPVFDFTTRMLPAGPGLAILGSESASDAVHDAVILPGARAASMAQRCETRLVIGHPAGPVIVVPGTAADRGGVHTLTAETYGRLRRAEDIARGRTVRAVILSGWNGAAGDGRSEAEQMMRAWAGPDVPIICDDAARSTAENALCSAAVIAALGQVREVIVVASWGNALRLRLAFRAALRDHGAHPRLSVIWGIRHGASWRPGLAGLFRLRRHLLAGRAMLQNGRQRPAP